MKSKNVLFTTDQFNLQNYSSGEIELSILRYGFEFIGYVTDLISAEHIAIDSYDLHVVFSTSVNFKNYLSKISEKSPIIVFPQLTSSISEVELERLKPIILRENSLIVCKTLNELDALRAYGAKNLLYEPGFFMEPQAFSKSKFDNFLIEKSYFLSFCNKGRVDGLLEFISQVDCAFILVVHPGDVAYFQKITSGFDVLVLPTIPYGSEFWFRIIADCTGFYEPNPHLTTSVLEALFLNKEVYSVHAEKINKAMGQNLDSSGEVKLIKMGNELLFNCLNYNLATRLEKYVHNAR